MLGFLDRARSIRRHSVKALGEDGVRSFDAVLDSLRDLQGIHEKAFLNLDNLEEVFGAIEMAQLIGKLADRTPQQIEQLREDFTTMVVRTLQLSVTFHNAEAGVGCSAATSFIKVVDAALQKGITVSLISFNYDLVMEAVMRSAHLGYDYGLTGEAPRNARILPLLKLHGSMNWHFCDQCADVYDANTFSHEYVPVGGGYMNVLLRPPVAHSCSHLPSRKSPVIVPPSWDKTRYQNSLRRVWARAARELGRADEIYVIGYSLPETDAFFRYLFALGTQSRTRIQRVLVVNPDRSVRPKFEGFIGQGLRPQLSFTTEGLFEDAMSEIGQKLTET